VIVIGGMGPTEIDAADFGRPTFFILELGESHLKKTCVTIKLPMAQAVDGRQSGRKYAWDAT